MTEQPLKDMQLQEKDGKEEGNYIGKLTRKSTKIKGVY